MEYMTETEEITAIHKNEIIKVISTALRLIDPRLVEHGERVSYIAYRIFQQGNLSDKLDCNTLFILCAFHDIGAYKTDEIDKMVQFETSNVWNHSIYGYCFLKNLTPLGDFAEAILFHHLPYSEFSSFDTKYSDYASLIFLADRIDILLQANPENCDYAPIEKYAGQLFNPEYVKLFLEANEKLNVQAELQSGRFRPTTLQLAYNINFSVEEALAYLKMLVYSIDFRSEHTVTHTINTTAISQELGHRLNLTADDLEKVYLGALLHDIGKLAIPLEILEYPGKLSPEQMAIMRKYVDYTETIISGLVSDEIAQIASRHHEKLDGSGYPHGLKAAALTTPQRIVAVADIISALTSARSYKDVFPKEKTIRILKELQANAQLDHNICDIAINDFDDIMRKTDSSRDPIITLYRTIAAEYTRIFSLFEEKLNSK